MNKDKVLKYLSFGTLALIVLAMMGATVLEKVKGTDVALSAVYHSPAVICLWIICCVSAIVLLLSRRVRSVSLLLVHFSFAVILAGALISFCTGTSYMLSLREGESDDSTLPFTVTLDTFEVEYYPLSTSPSDYKSSLTIRDEDKKVGVEVSMNHIGRYKGYRFYQSGTDGKTGSYLTVSRDVAGTAVTYAGYVLLLVGMLLQFFRKGSSFRRAIARLSGSATVLLCFLFVCPQTSARERHPQVLPDDVADAFEELYIYHNDRVSSFSTFARDYCLKAYGKSSYKGASATQVVTGWLFYYGQWESVPFKLKEKDKGGAVEMEKQFLFSSVASGAAFKVFPYRDEGKVKWYSCEDLLPVDISQDNWLFIKKSMDLVADCIREENWEDAKYYLSKIRAYQQKVCAEELPSEKQLALEKTYNAISLPKIPAMLSLTLGILLFLSFVVKIRRGKTLEQSPVSWWISQGILCALALYVFLILVLRGLVSGHLPMSNGFETMLVLSWITLIVGILLSGKLHMMHAFAFILSGFALLVSSLGQSNPQITHMAPVLNSPLLSVHVASMMISYSLLGISALSSLAGLLSGGKETSQLRDISIVVIYPALFTLIGGTVLGSIWANQSWGCYWSWDPKEVWSLVTIIVYSALLHTRVLKGLDSDRRFHLYTVLSFLCVIITYFGVNFFLGGMHSYA